MKLSVGHIAARCLRCGCAQFDAQDTAALSSDSILTCSSCGAKNAYHELMHQIGEQAIKEANESLARLRGKKNE